MASKRQAKKKEVDEAGIERAIEALVDEVRSEGCVTIAQLAKRGIPKTHQPKALQRCRVAGLDVQKTKVREPLVEQLRRRLEDGGAIAMRSLASATAGGSQKENKVALDALVKEGAGVYVLRGAELSALSARQAEVIEPASLEQKLAGLLAVVRAAKKKKAKLLSSDVRTEIEGLTPAPRTEGSAKVKVDVGEVVARTRALAGDTASRSCRASCARSAA